MNGQSSEPIIILLMFLARCLVPVLVLLGISYLLRRLGLIQEEPPLAPFETEEDQGGPDNAH